MSQLMQVCLLIILFYLIEPSVQSRTELSKLLNDSIRKKQELNRWLTQAIKPLKSRFDMYLSNDYKPYEDALMLVHLINKIRRLYEKLISSPVYWYSR